MTTATFEETLTYTAPGPAIVAESDSVAAPYTASAVGLIDIPATTAATTAFVVPVGSIAKIKAVKITNTNESDIGIRLNGAVADEFQLAPGGSMTICQPIASTANDLTAVSVVTTALQVAAGNVEYRVFGD